MIDIKKNTIGEWIVTDNDNVILKTCDISKANMLRERLVEDFIRKGSYITKDTTKLISYKWTIRQFAIYMQIVLLVDNEEKIIFCNPKVNTDDEIKDMKAYGIDTDKLLDILSYI